MTGWNLPPGVTSSMIPGNRREDAIWDREADKFCSDCSIREDFDCENDPNHCERSKEFEKHVEAILFDKEMNEAEQFREGYDEYDN